MAFSDNLRDFRKSEMMTQEELGAAMNVSQKTISSWETGRTEPTMDEIVRLCKIFDCTIEGLTGTRARKIGEVGFEDIIVRICTTDDLQKLTDLQVVLDDRIKFLIEVKNGNMGKRIVEYAKRLKK